MPKTEMPPLENCMGARQVWREFPTRFTRIRIIF